MSPVFPAKFPPALHNLPLIHQGKTRDTFQTKSADELLIVATQRLSTHNVIHLSGVPGKDEVLTALTIFWVATLLEKMGIAHHLVAYGVSIYDHLPGKRSDYPSDLHHRAIIVKKLTMIPVEFIFRGYLVGSIWKKFYSKNLPNPYGIVLEPGLPLMFPFLRPVFTPTDKSETDEPLDAMSTRAQYSDASKIAENVFVCTGTLLHNLGLELIDTKLELGMDASGQVTVADEIVTPDSSRFCEFSKIRIGKEPPWLDKQIVRDEAERTWGTGEKVPLEFDPSVIQALSTTYYDIFYKITRMPLGVFQASCLDF